MLEHPHFQNDLAVQSNRHDCIDCIARLYCVTNTQAATCSSALGSIIKTKGPYKPGEQIYRRGSAIKTLFAIKSGSVKLETVTDEGNRLVGGFYFPGTLLGIDGIGGGSYPADAYALEETYLCALPFKQLERLCQSIPDLQRGLIRRLSLELSTTRYDCSALRQEIGPTRTLAFLRELPGTLQTQDASQTTTLRLVMTKQDIASYLGMSPECLSRSLKTLERQGLIKNNGNTITLF